MKTRKLFHSIPRQLLIFVLILSFLPQQSFAREKSSDLPELVSSPGQNAPQVETVADSLEYRRTDKLLIARGNVVVTSGQDRLTADYAEVNSDTGQAYARGHVILFRKKDPRARGDEVYYNFNDHTANFPNGSVVSYPWRCQGQKIEQVKDGLQVVENGVLTTCQGENPPYEIRAKKVTIREDDKMIARNITVYSLGKPIFWWPYLAIPLQQRNAPLTVSAGYNSRHGAFIKTTKEIGINENLNGRILADWRSERGFGGGGELDYHYGKWAEGTIKGYWTQDFHAPVPARTDNPFSQEEKRDRGRIDWKHRSDLDDKTFVLLRYSRLADEFFLQDFFEKEYRSEVEPQSFVTLQRNSEKYGFMTYVSKRMNRFESLVERLPEMRFDWRSQSFFHPRVFFESSTRFGHLSKRFNREPFDENVFRADQFNEWTAPLNFEGIKFTPFANIRQTYYSREKESDNDHYRVVAGFGADLRTQLYRFYDVSFENLGIEVNGLRHVFEPYVTAQSFHSSVSDEKLNRFDYIDTLDDAHSVTLGFENRLQTKRVVDGKMTRVDFVSLNTFMRYDFHPDGIVDASNWSTLGQEVVVRPYDWLQYEMRFDYDMKRDKFRVFNNDIVARTKRFRLVFGHRYINDIEGLDIDGSSQFVFDGQVILNSLWGLGGYIRWDAKAQELEEWQLSASRNMGCLVFDFGYNVRNSSIRSGNKTLFFQLRLSHFPELSFRAGGGRASFSEPRIGETVSGSNRANSPFNYFNEQYYLQQRGY